MKTTLRITVLSTVLAVFAAFVPTADAQFNFGNLQFGGSGRGPSVNLDRGQFRPAVEPRWQAPATSPITDMRYRGPNPGHGAIDPGNIGLAIEAAGLVRELMGGTDCPPETCPTAPPNPVVCPTPLPSPEPAPVAPEPITDPVVDQAERALQMTYAAQEAFRMGQYQSAEDRMTEALTLSPNSAAAYQFRALTHFAQQDFDNGAADIYETLLRGPIWNWETVYPLYGEVAKYTDHYKALSLAAKGDEDSMSKHFLLAYHHLMLGHLEHGEQELQKVLAIQPNESVTQRLLVSVQRVRAANDEQVANR